MTLLYSVLICLFAQIDAEYLFLKTVEKEKILYLKHKIVYNIYSLQTKKL